MFKFLSGLGAKNWAIIILALVVVGSVGNLYYNYKDLQSKYENALLVIDQKEAELDTTRLVLVEALGENVKVYQRRIVQVEQRADALSEELGVLRRVQARLTIKVDSLTSELSSPVREAGDTLRMDFNENTEPFDISVEVTVPPPDPVTLVRPDATAIIRASLAPIPLNVFVGCNPNPDRSLNEATINLVAPEWAQLRVDEVSQDPEVCNPRLAEDYQSQPFYKKPVVVAVGTAILTFFIAR